MLKIGITGGIASGKSRVSKIFEGLGIPVYYADDRAKALMLENKDLKQKIITHFGEQAYTAEGELNRSYLARTVFSEPSQAKQLESWVHPIVADDYEKWHEAQDNHLPYTLKEAALLFETGSYKDLDFIILVSASEQVRLARTLARDAHRDEAQVKQIMAKQWSEEARKKATDWIIDNEGEALLIPQVLRLHKQIVKMSKS
ncbi:MAG: dephospho-CoA kinase [Bernardetiaceae bacterium]|nr:dephospho-CoA kinase [Bernardetiaceae bacterium]